MNKQQFKIVQDGNLMKGALIENGVTFQMAIENVSHCRGGHNHVLTLYVPSQNAIYIYWDTWFDADEDTINELEVSREEQCLAAVYNVVTGHLNIDELVLYENEGTGIGSKNFIEYVQKAIAVALCGKLELGIPPSSSNEFHNINTENITLELDTDPLVEAGWELAKVNLNI